MISHVIWVRVFRIFVGEQVRWFMNIFVIRGSGVDGFV